MITKLHDRAFAGDINPLQAYAQAKYILDKYTKLVDELKEFAQEEADKYPKQFEDFGFNFEKRNGRTIYDFKHLPQWQQADKLKKMVEEQSKQALKAMERGDTIVDADGCIIEPPKVSYTKDVLIIKKL